MRVLYGAALRRCFRHRHRLSRQDRIDSVTKIEFLRLARTEVHGSRGIHHRGGVGQESGVNDLTLRIQHEILGGVSGAQLNFATGFMGALAMTTGTVTTLCPLEFDTVRRTRYVASLANV